MVLDVASGNLKILLILEAPLETVP